MAIMVAAGTRSGTAHAVNEDRVLVGGLVLSPGCERVVTVRMTAAPLVVAVFDGMGGHRGGTVASASAADELARHERATIDSRLMARALESANRRLFAEMTSETSAMGATVCALAVADDRVVIGNVGDTRCYVESANALTQRTVDDVVAGSHRLTQSLGGLDKYVAVEPHVVEAEWRGRRFVLLSDGAYRALSHDELEACMVSDDAASARLILDAATRADGGDDISVAIVRVTDDASP